MPGQCPFQPKILCAASECGSCQIRIEAGAKANAELNDYFKECQAEKTDWPPSRHRSRNVLGLN
jgi:hypothetical protein